MSVLKKILNTDQLKVWAVEQVLWAENNLKDKSGADKKAAVIKRLDDLIVLPFYLEWVDDIVISWLVDAVCDKLNSVTGHNFSEAKLSSEQEKELVKDIELSEEAINGH